MHGKVYPETKFIYYFFGIFEALGFQYETLPYYRDPVAGKARAKRTLVSP